MTTEKRAGKECFILKNGNTEAALTRLGGHMAPVRFYTDTETPVEPYYVSPWQEEDIAIDVPILEPLRGDFFCMPFGANEEDTNPFVGHGDPSTRDWEYVSEKHSDPVTTLTLGMELKQSAGSVTKEVSIIEGEQVIYTRDTISGVSGPMPLGHHATLGTHNGELTIRTSPISFGRCNPYDVLHTQGREYYSCASLGRFTELEDVPTIWKVPESTDCTVFPAREGYVDIIQSFQQDQGKPAWTTAVCREAGYLWFSLKDVSVLPSVLFWMENHGRHGSPWNGRNCCIGLEDVCSYFANGYEDSIGENPLVTEEGAKTAVQLDGSPFTVSYIQGVVRIPEGFNAVSDIDFSEDWITFIEESGSSVVTVPCRWDFVFGKSLD